MRYKTHFLIVLLVAGLAGLLSLLFWRHAHLNAPRDISPLIGADEPAQSPQTSVDGLADRINGPEETASDAKAEQEAPAKKWRSGEDASELIKVSEQSLIPTFDYQVDIQTVVLTASNQVSNGDSVTMGFDKDAGLRVTGGATGSFSVDVASMLRKMSGLAEWSVETLEAVGAEECVLVSSSGDAWLVRLWIRPADGAVLRYDQYLQDKLVASTRLSYDEFHAALVPADVKITFPITDRVVQQTYHNYKRGRI